MGLGVEWAIGVVPVSFAGASTGVVKVIPCKCATGYQGISVLGCNELYPHGLDGCAIAAQQEKG